MVGPRPHMLKHTEQYSALIDKYMVRHLVKPGVNGWAQVTGTEVRQDAGADGRTCEERCVVYRELDVLP